MMLHNRRNFFYILIPIALVFLYILFVSSRIKPVHVNSRYSYYLCTQIFNESEHYLIDWLDHHFNVIGFKNVCLINTGHPLSISLRNKYPIAYFEKKGRQQDFQYCLSSCFRDEPMRPEDMLLIQDVDEYLNVRQADEIFRNYNKYDRFHFLELRYGYVLETDKAMLNQSVRTANLWRKPYYELNENEDQNLRDRFNCTTYGGWPACNDGNGKEMIRVGAIESLGIHSHKSTNQFSSTLEVDPRKIRINHYMMRTKEDAVRSAEKWYKLPSRIGQIAVNSWFKIIFDDSILKSKRLI